MTASSPKTKILQTLLPTNRLNHSANTPIHPYISFSKENTDKGGQKDDETQILEAEALQFTRCIYHFQKLDKDEA